MTLGEQERTGSSVRSTTDDDTSRAMDGGSEYPTGVISNGWFDDPTGTLPQGWSEEHADLPTQGWWADRPGSRPDDHDDAPTRSWPAEYQADEQADTGTNGWFDDPTGTLPQGWSDDADVVTHSWPADPATQSWPATPADEHVDHVDDPAEYPTGILTGGPADEHADHHADDEADCPTSLLTGGPADEQPEESTSFLGADRPEATTSLLGAEPPTTSSARPDKPPEPDRANPDRANPAGAFASRQRKSGMSAGTRGVMLRLLLVLVVLGVVGGAVVVTKPQLLSGFGSTTSRDPGSIIAPDDAQPGGLGALPVMPVAPGLPPGAPIGAIPPPPALGPGLPPGAPPPGGLPLPPAGAGGAGGLGVGDVVGALFDSAKGSFASHFDNSGGEGLIQDGFYPSVVANPQMPGRQAFQFAIAPGGLRSEVLPVGPGTQPVNGEEQFVRYSAMTSRDFPTTTSEYNIIMQWHHQANTGSPPLALQIERGQLMMVSGGDDYQSIGPYSPGQPINLTMSIRFSMDPSQAAVTVWRDGRPTGVTNWHPVRGTMFTPGAYLKVGMYRSRSIVQGGALTITDLKVARTSNGIGGIGPLAAR